MRFADVILNHLQSCENKEHVAAFRVPVSIEQPVVQLVKSAASFADQLERVEPGAIRHNGQYGAFLSSIAGLCTHYIGSRLNKPLLIKLLAELESESKK